MNLTAKDYSLGWILSSGVGTAVMMALAFSEIQRVARGELFTFAFPWERLPSQTELNDAKLSAQQYLVPAMLSLVMVGAIIGFTVPQARRHVRTFPKYWRSLTVVFVLAVLADLSTTVWFFHVRGVDHELHPGIRLFGYAYGRTVGPIAGKLIQAIGVLSLSFIFVRGGTALQISVTVLYTIAAIYNFSLM